MWLHSLPLFVTCPPPRCTVKSFHRPNIVIYFLLDCSSERIYKLNSSILVETKDCKVVTKCLKYPHCVSNPLTGLIPRFSSTQLLTQERSRLWFLHTHTHTRIHTHTHTRIHTHTHTQCNVHTTKGVVDEQSIQSWLSSFHYPVT